MIVESKVKPALWALNAVLVRLRQMAFDQVDSRVIADLADAAEELPMLIVREGDLTTVYRQALEAMEKRFGGLEFALQRFDETV